MKKLTIIGGGITGLASAYIASKNGYGVTIIEKSTELGGLMRTFKIGKRNLEFYYHHFFTHDSELQWLFRELGIEKKVLFQKTTMGVFRENKIYNFNSPLDLLKYKPLGILDKFRFALTTVYLGKIANWRKMENISALDWFYKYAGKGATENLWKPLIDVKFGPFAKEVPVSWMIGRLAQRMGSRKSTDEHLGYLEGSLNVLQEHLLKALKKNGVKIIVNTEVIKLNVKNKELKSIKTSKGILSGGNFLFTMPTDDLSVLLKSVNNSYSKEIGKIKYFGAICVILEMNKKLSDIYWLNIADPGYPFGGIIEQTNFISPKYYNNRHIVYLSRYFASTDPIAKMTKEEVQKFQLSYLKKIFPDFNEKNVKKIYVFKTNKAATVCDKNFSKKIPNCKTPIKNMFISSMAHIYPDERSCNNSIRIAAEVCRVMGINSDFVPRNSSLSGQIGMNQ